MNPKRPKPNQRPKPAPAPLLPQPAADGFNTELWLKLASGRALYNADDHKPLSTIQEAIAALRACVDKLEGSTIQSYDPKRWKHADRRCLNIAAMAILTAKYIRAQVIAQTKTPSR